MIGRDHRPGRPGQRARRHGSWTACAMHARPIQAQGGLNGQGGQDRPRRPLRRIWRWRRFRRRLRWRRLRWRRWIWRRWRRLRRSAAAAAEEVVGAATSAASTLRNPMAPSPGTEHHFLLQCATVRFARPASSCSRLTGPTSSRSRFMSEPYLPHLTKPSGKDTVFFTLSGSRNSTPDFIQSRPCQRLAERERRLFRGRIAADLSTRSRDSNSLSTDTSHVLRTLRS